MPLYPPTFPEPKESQMFKAPVIPLLSPRLLRRCLTIIGLWGWACLAGLQPAQARDHVVERGWLEDATGQMRWDEVRQLPTQPFGETLNRGYGKAVLWLRLRIDPNLAGPDEQHATGQLVLRMRPAYLDEVKVFDPLAPGGVVGVVGDRYHPRQDIMPGADFMLPLARGDAPRDIWLRLATTSTRQIHAAVVDPADLDVMTMRQSMVASLYLGLVLVLLVWGVVHRLLHREAVMGAYALMQLTAALFGLSSLGILRVFWPVAWSAEWLNALGSVFSIAVVTAGLWFHLSFLREFRPAPWAIGLLYCMLALSGVNVVLLALGEVIPALQSNMVSLLLISPLCLLCALTGRAWNVSDGQEHPALSRRVLVTFYAVFLVIFTLATTSGLGLLQATEWTIYIGQLHALVSSLLLMLMLQYRTYVLRQQQQEARLKYERTALQVVTERQLREEQERLLAMLAHEIKTPLATMHLRLDGQAKGGQAIRQAMRDMNMVIDRCVQTLKIGDGRLQPQMQLLDLVKSVHDAQEACSAPERVRLQMPPRLSCQSDPQLLSIILHNLLENACKYSAPDTDITLQCTLDESQPERPMLRIDISNQPGKAGWPDPQQVFDKYYRAPHAQRQAGTGLGLYLVHSLARSLGGSIAYQPDEQFVRFVLLLPQYPVE